MNTMKTKVGEKEVYLSFHEIPVWTGIPIKDSYGNKPILNYKGEPVYAELYALKKFIEKGYDGVWVDTYRRRYRTKLPENQKEKLKLPDFAANQLSKIWLNGKLSGTWDLFLWKDKQFKFVELKRKGKDKIRQSQIDFLERALKIGFMVEDFEVFEWVEKGKTF